MTEGFGLGVREEDGVLREGNDTQSQESHTHTHTHMAPRLHFPLPLGLWPQPWREQWATVLPLARPAQVPSFFLHSSDACFPSRLLYRSPVPLRGLEALAALEDEDMARGPDNTLQWATLVVLAAVGTAVTAATNPGVVARITQKGLDYGNQSLPSLISHP